MLSLSTQSIVRCLFSSSTCCLLFISLVNWYFHSVLWGPSLITVLWDLWHFGWRTAWLTYSVISQLIEKEALFKVQILFAWQVAWKLNNLRHCHRAPALFLVLRLQPPCVMWYLIGVHTHSRSSLTNMDVVSIPAEIQLEYQIKL